jgi:uncharacterized Zn finger protein
MKKDLYRKARNLFEEGRVRVGQETEKAVYLTVRGDTEEYSVILRRDGKHSCTCPYATIHADKEAICSHICASIALLMFAGR